MMTSFHVENFKSIQSETLELRRFMVLVGPNGAGKTNAVRALKLFGELLDRGTTDPAREEGWGRIIRRGKKPARSGIGFKATFSIPGKIFDRQPMPSSSHDDAVHVDIELRLGGAVGDDDVTVSRERLALRRGDLSFGVEFSPSGISLDEGNDVFLARSAFPEAEAIGNFFARDSGHGPASILDRVRDYLSFVVSEGEHEAEPSLLRLLNRQRLRAPWFNYCIRASRVSRFRLYASALRGDAQYPESLGRELVGPHGEGLAAAVDHLKKRKGAWEGILVELQRVYPQVKEVHAKSPQPGRWTLSFEESGINAELGQDSVSDGVLHALALLIMLSDQNASGILAIEEPENGIHPWSIRAMVERAQNGGGRVTLVTTHSETVVNAVRDPASLFIVESEPDGTHIRPALSVETALAAILRESGQQLGDVWMGGTLGGVPSSGNDA